MTYIATDRAGGQPIELITFSTVGRAWRYTTTSQDVTVNGINYISAIMQSSRLVSSSKLTKDKFEIKVGEDIELLTYLKNLPTRLITATIQEFHTNDPDQEVITRADGVISFVKRNNSRENVLHCVSKGQAANRSGINRNYQVLCPYVLYGTKCGVASGLYRFNTSVSLVDSNMLTLTSITQADGYYTGGYIEFNNGEYLERRSIYTHAVGVITIDSAFEVDPTGQQVSIFAGCEHTLDDCNNKFSNGLNYGGQPYFGDKNPMNGDNIF